MLVTSPATAAPIGLFLVCHLRVYRESVVRVLRQEPTVRIVGERDGVEGLPRAVHAADPDMLVLDSAIPGAVEVLPAVRGAVARLHVVVLGVRDHASDVVAWAEVGATGYVPPEASIDDFLKTIGTVANDELRCSPAVAAALIRRVSTLAREGESAPNAVLTPREHQILELVEQGLSNKEIAQGLCITLATVKSHIHNILEKLHARRRGEAAALLRRLDGAVQR